MLSPQATSARCSSPLDERPSKIRGVDSLPDELLCEIFRHLQGDWLPGSWCRVLWVCRRWSAVGRSTAALWSEITIRGRPNTSLITASLEYSKNTFLDIDLDDVVPLAQILSLLSPHIHRIRIFKLSIHMSGHGSIPYTDGSELATFLNHDFPSLENFEERTSPHRRSLTWRPNASGYPRLRRLCLEGYVSIKMAPTTVFPALRTLVLGYQNEPSFTLPSFVQFLSRHLHLEQLCLSMYKPALDGSLATLTFPPTIRSFSFTDDTRYIKGFLSAFTHIPAHVDLIIMRNCNESWTEISANTSLFVARMLPESPRSYFHVLSGMDSLIIDSAGFHYNLIGLTHLSDIGSPWIRLNSFFPVDFIWDTPFQRLTNATHVFAGSPITEVELRCERDHHQPPRSAEWVALLDAFPLLEHIVVEDIPLDGEHDVRPGLLKALLASSVDGKTRWPQLRRLTLGCGDWWYRNGAFVSDRLPRVLRHRAEQGAKVVELCLVFKYKVWTVGAEEMDRMALEVVERAVWKDIVGDVRVKFVRPW